MSLNALPDMNHNIKLSLYLINSGWDEEESKIGGERHENFLVLIFHGRSKGRSNLIRQRYHLFQIIYREMAIPKAGQFRITTYRFTVKQQIFLGDCHPLITLENFLWYSGKSAACNML